MTFGSITIGNGASAATRRSFVGIAASMFCLTWFIAPALSQASNQFTAPTRKVPFGDWDVECFGPRLTETCQVYQRVLMNQGRAVALVATFAYPPTGNAINFQIAVPLGIEISKGAQLRIGADFSAQLPITRCTQQGCLLEGAIALPILTRLMTAKAATVTVRNPGVADFPIPVSLNGFDKAVMAIAPERRPEPAVEVTPESEDTDESAPGSTEAEQSSGQTNGIAVEGGPVDLVAPLPDESDDGNRLAPVTGDEQKEATQ